MQGKYRKITVEMKRENEGYRFWKRGEESPVCYVESYKEKRAVFFHGQNLLPGENYHLILMGNSDGRVEHQDFGPLHTAADGALQCYRTFSGAPLDSYQFCILCADRGDGDMDIVYKGAIFGETEDPWNALCQKGTPTEAFTAGRDETEADWYRLDDLHLLPPACRNCLPWMSSYGHYIIGRKKQRYYLGVAGRFLQREQPLREEGVFLLWQPIRGGEAFFERPDLMTVKEQEEIFGYWIAGVNPETGELQPV